MSRGPRVTEEEEKKIKELRQHISVREIMQRTGRSMATVYKALKEKQASDEHS